ncbi:uncharacterized protein LOC118438901 [Folsomia candida]|uniref:uncharacterized protein LOC118438901 n=1 Tax=Folsomia candida TaxID=158441 RepID=UPI001604AF33|nr:uncharacterized protein LOC118438901 [Folsomia candida]
MDLGLAARFKFTFPHSYYAKEIVKVTPYTEFLAGEADLLPFFDTNLRVRSAQGKSCCFLFPQPPTTRVTIENEQQVGERAEFVGQLSFDYPNYWKDVRTYIDKYLYC